MNWFNWSENMESYGGLQYMLFDIIFTLADAEQCVSDLTQVHIYYATQWSSKYLYFLFVFAEQAYWRLKKEYIYI